MLLSPSLLLVLCAHFTFGLGSNDDLPLRVLYIGSSSPVEALDRAEEDINNSSSLLSGYRVQIVKGNSTVFRVILKCVDIGPERVLILNYY